MRVLIVDEDPTLARDLLPVLKREGHRVRLRPPGHDFCADISTRGIDLVILNSSSLPLNLICDLCHLIRRDSSALLLVVGGQTDAPERARVLEAGADDCLASPYDPDELLARVHALLRRHPLNLLGHGSSLIQVTEELSLDLSGQRLLGDRREIPLTGKEFQLLACLLRYEGAIMSREALLAAVWGPDYEGSTREVDVYIRYLRRKIEPDPSRPRYIRSAWGRGYQFRRPPPGG